MKVESQTSTEKLEFHMGVMGALLPFLVFVSGVIYLALSGAPDEKGFWPVLLLALALGLLLSKDKTAFSKTVVKGMSQEIVMIMIMAWILASIIGILMTITGFVEALIWLFSLINLNNVGFIVAVFIICGIVSLSTGSSFATILICGPLLYPTGGMLGAHLPTLAGAILAGATFGDFFAPISDTTIASALSQQVTIGDAVKSRVKYIIPATLIALVGLIASANIHSVTAQTDTEISGSPEGLPMMLVPVIIIYLFLKGKHLIHGLLFGLMIGMALGLGMGLLSLDQVLKLDTNNFTSTSFIIDGINRAVGISFFTILLMGLVATLKASNTIALLVDFASTRSKTRIGAEGWIAVATGAAVLLTTHSIVAILTVSEFANSTGKQTGLSGVRRANILSLVVCIFPFLLPYFIPVILMANTTNSGADFGIAAVSPLEVGLYNFLAWGLMAVTIVVVIFGYGTASDNRK